MQGYFGTKLKKKKVCSYMAMICIYDVSQMVHVFRNGVFGK